MKRKDFENQINLLLQKYLITDEIELIDVEFVKEGPNHYLRVFIDKAKGITIDDCEKISKFLDEHLDDYDKEIDTSYYLEVSSPGLDRPIKTKEDYLRNIGDVIEVKFYQAINGQKQLAGVLKEYCDEGLILLLDDDNEIYIKHDQIALAKLAIVI